MPVNWKSRPFILIAMCFTVLGLQLDWVESGVYRWNELKAARTDEGEIRSILEGATTALAHLNLYAVNLDPGIAHHAAVSHKAEEELIIVKDGEVTVALGDERRSLGPGSIALVLPGETHSFVNAGNGPATFYVFRYSAKKPVDVPRGKKAGGSFTVDWNEVPFQETATGGRRQHFDRATAMFERFEMHVSTLNENLTNHAAHTHLAEEFVLIIKSDVQMQVGDTHPKAARGDVIFLDSMIPHSLDNIGVGQTEYFAFQWE